MGRFFLKRHNNKETFKHRRKIALDEPLGTLASLNPAFKKSENEAATRFLNQPQRVGLIALDELPGTSRRKKWLAWQIIRFQGGGTGAYTLVREDTSNPQNLY